MPMQLKRCMKPKRGLGMVFALWVSLTLSAQVQAVSDSSGWTQSSSETNTTLKEQGQILLFVSSSMPATSLKEWFIQAQRFGAVVIIRGLVNNSLLATKAWLTSSIEQIEDKGGIEINPVAFEAFGITQVPAVVVTTGKLQCVSNEHCIAPPFDVVYGNMSLYEALHAIAERGCVGSVLAKQTLTEGKEAP
jgi:type-F conjugative transfer system pilin assembly protein TrbC